MNTNLNFLFALLAVTLIASLALMSRSCGSTGQPPAFAQRLTLAEAISQSRESGRPVLAFFTADWCGPCQKLKRGPLSSGRITRWIETNTEPVYVDATRSQSDTELQTLLSRYRVRAFPTLLMIEPGRELEERGRLQGVPSQRELLRWLESMQNRPAPEPTSTG
jgi:thiol:disulfide interchange protein